MTMTAIGTNRYDSKSLTGPELVPETTGPLSVLNDDGMLTNSNGSRNINFPKNELHDIGHWVTFSAFSIDQIKSASRAEKEVKGRVRLPMPGNLATAYNLDYSISNQSALGKTAFEDQSASGIGTTAASAGATGFAVARNKFMKMALAGMTLAGGIVAGNAATNGDASGPVGLALDVAERAALGNNLAIALKQFGLAKNPHKVVLFEGVGMRTHSFTWNLVPLSRQDSNDIYNLIQFFKYHSAPGFKSEYEGLSLGKHLFTYPEFFMIQYHFPHYLYNIAPSFLRSVEVNYHPAGVPSYKIANEGSAPAPSSVILTLQFQETEVLTKDDIKNRRM